MNKYYIGYSLPEHLREKIRELYMHVMGNCELVDVGQLHITALHLGAYPRDEAEKIFHSLTRRTLPILCSLDTYDRFGDHLVIKLQPNDELTAIHQELGRLAGKGTQDTWGYNPHITVAHGKKAFIRVACPEVQFTLPTIVLFEKQSGGVYEPTLVTGFR